MIAGNVVGLSGITALVPVSLLANTIALVVMTVCFNAYVMDYIERTSMSKNEIAAAGLQRSSLVSRSVSGCLADAMG